MFRVRIRRWWLSRFRCQASRAGGIRPAAWHLLGKRWAVHKVEKHEWWFLERKECICVITCCLLSSVALRWNMKSPPHIFSRSTRYATGNTMPYVQHVLSYAPTTHKNTKNAKFGSFAFHQTRRPVRKLCLSFAFWWFFGALYAPTVK